MVMFYSSTALPSYNEEAKRCWTPNLEKETVANHVSERRTDSGLDEVIPNEMLDLRYRGTFQDFSETETMSSPESMKTFSLPQVTWTVNVTSGRYRKQCHNVSDDGGGMFMVTIPPIFYKVSLSRIGFVARSFDPNLKTLVEMLASLMLISLLSFPSLFGADAKCSYSD